MTTATELEIVIDGKTYPLRDDDQEAADLIRLAGKDPAVYDLLKVLKHGDEHVFRDRAIINLKSGDTFRVRALIHFTVDGQEFESYDDDREASSLIRLAGLDPASYDLARKHANGQPEVFRDDEVIRIANGDKFTTSKHMGEVQ